MDYAGGMDEMENPYAAPTSVESNSVRRAPAPDWRYPHVTLAMSVFLWANIASIVFYLLLWFGAAVDPEKDELTVFHWLLIYLWLPWMIVGWPIASLAPLIYCATVDFGMPRAALKAITALLMFGAWVAVCLFVA